MYRHTKSSDFAEMMRVAAKRGESTRGHRRLVFDGTYSPRMTFAGPFPQMHGRIICSFEREPLYIVDFDKSMTWQARGQRTNLVTMDLIHWRYELYKHFRLPMCVLSDSIWHPSSVYTGGVAKVTLRRREMLCTFLTRAPWYRPESIDGRRGWFHWPSFDEALVDQHEASERLVWTDQNWRYFTFEWDENGNWVQRFVDENARRRYRLRCKRRDKAAAAEGTANG